MSPEEGSTGGGAPRADARRNEERLIAAAREAVAELGADVTAHQIARRAGVGIGTFYRRLPSRDELLVAILRDSIEQGLVLAAAALADHDPWIGFTMFAEGFVQLRTASCGLNDALAGRTRLDLPLAEMRDAIRRLVERAQRHGSLRDDVDWTDVAFLLAGITVDHTLELTPAHDQWRRSLRVLLAGLAAPAPSSAAATRDDREDDGPDRREPAG